MSALIAIALGLFAGYIMGYRAINTLARRLSCGSMAPRFVRGGAWIGALLMLWPSFILAIVIGGTLGGGWGETVSTAMGLGGIGVPFGIAAGMTIVMTTGISLGALIGGAFGKAAACSLIRMKLGFQAMQKNSAQ